LFNLKGFGLAVNALQLAVDMTVALPQLGSCLNMGHLAYISSVSSLIDIRVGCHQLRSSFVTQCLLPSDLAVDYARGKSTVLFCMIVNSPLVLEMAL